MPAEIPTGPTAAAAPSAVGPGSTTATTPPTPAGTAAVSGAAATARPAAAARAQSPATRILHVDDDEANRYAITRTLVRAGFDVVEAADGKAALEKAAAIRPDLIILDVRLPDMDGFEVCRRIKADPSTTMVPVLHLSASFTSSDDRARGLNTGADSYLIRPVAPEELLATINALLRVRRSEEALRASEERFRAAFAGAAVGMILSDLRGRILQANEAAAKMTGFGPSQLTALDLRTLTHPEDREATDRLVRQVIDDEIAPSLSSEKRYVRADGSTVWVQESLSLARDPAGRPASLIVLAQDITARRLAESQLVAARETAETANRLKDDFLATLSHELRTPLTAIVGWASLLRRGGTKLTEKDRDEGLSTIERNAKAQTQLIEDLLDVSRIISGKLRLDMQTVSLNGVLDNALDAVRLAADQRRVRLRGVYDPSQTLNVNGDASRLQQVVSNLLTNAIKFTPEGGEVTLSLTPQPDGHALIVVKDSGRGIDPQFLPYVFERFRQADASTKRGQGGLGLGLAIVRQLVELHHGSVAAHSEGLGKGASFSVKLPLLRRGEADAPAGAPGTSDVAGVLSGESHESATPLHGLSVLVVEDDDDCRALACHVLSSVGAACAESTTVAEAMHQLRSARFDLIVSDIGMPSEDGFDLIRQLRALPPDRGGRTPAAALSAFAQPATRQRMLDSGFQMAIAKPVDPNELVDAARRLCGR